IVKIGVNIIGADLQVLVGIKVAHAVGHNRAFFQGGEDGKGFVAPNQLTGNDVMQMLNQSTRNQALAALTVKTVSACFKRLYR
ncbi:hypothetical protein ACRPFF_11730, partial [Neisseria sp. SLRRB23]